MKNNTIFLLVAFDSIFFFQEYADTFFMFLKRKLFGPFSGFFKGTLQMIKNTMYSDNDDFFRCLNF